MANNGKKKTSTEISNNILDALEILTSSSIQSAQFDKTITGIIVSCEDENIGKYKVQYQDAIFIAYSSSLDVKYSKGTSVQVKIPNNDFNGRKMIIGTVEEGGIDFGDTVEDPLLRYEIIGKNCIDMSSEFSMSSYWPASVNTRELYDKDRINVIGLDEYTFEESIRQGDSVLLGATIRTAIPEEQKFNGNYGIIYTFTFKDPMIPDTTVDKNYIVDIDKMTGDPYSYINGSEQIIPFDIDRENFLYVKKIELFAYDFLNIDASEPADIFIGNIRLQAARRLDSDEFNTTGLVIIQPEGNYFSGTEGKDTKTAVAQLQIQGKVTNSSAIEYYWFEEDLTITKTDNLYYSKYGGRGWRCLNAFTVLSGTDAYPEAIEFINAGDTFTFNKNDSKARDRYYKCVAIYRDQVFSKEFSFVNYDITQGASIECDRGSSFVDNIGATTLTCTAPGAVEYIWATIDGDKTFSTVIETAADNNRYHSAVENYTDLYNDILNGNKADNSTNQAQLQYYKSIMDEFDMKVRVEDNQVINLQASSIFGSITYKCQAFDGNGDSLGIASQVLTNSLKDQNDKQIGNLTIHNGTQIFRYDANGIAPTSTQFENPQVIQPLGFTLRTAEGIEIPQASIKDIDISWIVPIKDSMLKGYTGTLESEDEENGIAVYNGKNLSYTINENYYSRRDNNTIQLQVMYLGILYTATTDFVFVKDGDTGTNGTDLVVRLIPATTNNGRIQIMDSSITSTASNWFTVEVWRNGVRVYNNVHSGISTENKEVNIVWSLVGTRNTPHGFSVTSNGSNAPVWRPGSYTTNNVDIAKATVTYNGVTVVATAPVAWASMATNYRVGLKRGTGFTHVVYTDDGKQPSYESHAPFEILVEKYIEGTWTDVTDKEGFQFDWRIIGNLREKNPPDGFIGGTSMNGKYFGTKTFDVIPDENYDETVLNHALTCEVWKVGSGMALTETFARIHIPIHFMMNAYGHSAINDWDGNSIELDADGNTMLLAPQAGFGDKDNYNRFNGVLLGKVSTSGVTSRGLMGYYQGERTIFLNSDNGSATFGKSGKGQIIFDPTNDTAVLKSGNYSTSNKTGMQINLTTPEIRFGSGKFYVTSDGILHAVDGEFEGTITAEDGTIGGWDIDSNSIHYNRPSFETRSSQGTHIGSSGISIGKTYISPDGTIKSYYSTTVNDYRRTEISNTGFKTVSSYGITTCLIDNNELTFYADKTIDGSHIQRQTFRVTSGSMTITNPDTDRLALAINSSGITYYRSTDRTDGRNLQYLFRVDATSGGGLTLYDYDAYDRPLLTANKNGFYLYDSTYDSRVLLKAERTGLYSYNSNGDIAFSVTDSYGLRVFYSSGRTAMQANANGLCLYHSNGNTSMRADSSGLFLYNDSGNKLLDVDSTGLWLYNNGTTRMKATSSGLYLYNNDGKTTATVGAAGIHLYDGEDHETFYVSNTRWTGTYNGSGNLGAGVCLPNGSPRYYLSLAHDSEDVDIILDNGMWYKNVRHSIQILSDTCTFSSFWFYHGSHIDQYGNLKHRFYASQWDDSGVPMMVVEPGFYVKGEATVHNNLRVWGNLYVSGGDKQRVVETKDFGYVSMSAYETATPYFGDIGQGECDENGFGYVYIDEIFQQTIQQDTQYYVFLQGLKGNVELWEQETAYFVVKGAPYQKFNFEIKARQVGVENMRMDTQDESLFNNTAIDPLPCNGVKGGQIENAIK